MKFRDADDVYAYLNRFLNFERKLEPTEYRLDRMERLKELFGRPDEYYRIVHVAGSKGKGSTATMMAAVMEQAGRTVGLYTSPHLLSFTERIAVGREPVETRILLECAQELSARMEHETAEDFPGGEAPTYFELLTLLAFLCFRRAGCDDAVIEVGLGGRLDSTNVVRPVACLITSIELEHTDLLGDTIAKIAYEKAGIMKPGVPAFTSAARPEALEVFKKRASELPCPLTVLDEAAELRNVEVDERGTGALVYRRGDGRSATPLAIRTPLIGGVQARNAALVALAAAELGYSDEAIARGVAEAKLRARFEIVPGDPVVILDGAHTADSVRATVDDFRRLFPGGGSLLFGCAKGKPPRPMAAALRDAFSEAVITKPGTFKESDTAELAQAFESEGFRVRVIEDTRLGVETALAEARGQGRPLLVTGSFYLCAEAARIVDRRADS